MFDTNSLAFRDSGLQRAGHLRSDPARLRALYDSPAARVLPFWRGKPLIAGDVDTLAPGWLPTGAAGLEAAVEAPLFLGMDADTPRFALDLSAWEPDAVPEGALEAFFDPSEQVHPAFPPQHRFAELRGAMTGLTPRDAELAATARALLSWHTRHRFCSNCGAATDITQGGWQRDCATCDGKHFPRTDPVVIMLITHGNSLLLGRSPQWPEGMYSLLAGFVEPGETLEAAVRREVAEETSVDVGAVHYLASQPWPFPSSLMLACHGIARSTEITVDPVEIEDACWITREELLEVFTGAHPTIRAPRRGAIAGFIMAQWLADRLGDMPR
ncbi:MULTISPECIES: NAD(+) diphosphatase [unclassified Meridianimarinicoccus]|uniref:NAD(+) diphosphatase n=1 Tax=unclassified Meridianimarinicoccus TaxID=2923344 RepID=UPI001866876D|nr:NAD(+) diphosphatase [Fluviibacterium sp. MJW13]